MEAAPRWKRFVTHPRAIMGQESSIRSELNATKSPRVMSSAITREPPYQRTTTAARPVQTVRVGWKAPQILARSMFRSRYSSFSPPKASAWAPPRV